MENKIYSIGYGNLQIEDFILVLKKFDIKMIIDVRGKPYSNWNSSYIGKNLARILKGTGIQYVWSHPLRGRTSDKPFEYYTELKRIINYSKKNNLVLMCAEFDPRKCHRYFKLTPDIEKYKSVSHIYRNEVVDPEDIKDGKKEKKSLQLYLL